MENTIEKVKRKLWSFGYACKGVSKLPGLDYDLLVEGEHRVKVISKGDSRDSIPMTIVVAEVDGDDIKYHICKRGVCREESSPLKAFAKSDREV